MIGKVGSNVSDKEEDYNTKVLINELAMVTLLPTLRKNYAVFMASGVFVEQKLPDGQTRSLFAPVGRKKKYKIHLKMKRMKPEEKKKKRAGRPAKNIKKEINASVRFSRSEYYIVKEKAAGCGFSVSNYIRRAAIYPTITPRLTEEEQYFARQLVGMANNLNQLAKACHQEGLLQSMAFFENYRQHLNEIIKKLKP